MALDDEYYRKLNESNQRFYGTINEIRSRMGMVPVEVPFLGPKESTSEMSPKESAISKDNCAEFNTSARVVNSLKNGVGQQIEPTMTAIQEDSGCALQTRQLIPNGETQAPPPSPIVQSGERMRPPMDSLEESVPGARNSKILHQAPPIHDYGDPDDEINDFLETHEAPLPPTPLPSPMVDIPAPLLSTETPAPLPSPDVLMLVHSSTPIQETMEHSFFSQIEAKQGINRHSRIDFQFFDELIPKLSPLVSYLSNSSAHHMFDEMPDQFGCQSNWVFDSGGDFESAYGTELVGSLDISSAHDMFDKMPSRDIDALLDKKPTLCSDWKLFGSDWKLFAISFPYDRGKLWHSNSFGDAFKKMVHFDSTQIQELFCYSGEIDVFTSQFGRESFAVVLLMWLFVCGCQLKCHSIAIEKLRSNCCCVAEVFVADVRLLVICWAKFLSFMVQLEFHAEFHGSHCLLMIVAADSIFHCLLVVLDAAKNQACCLLLGASCV